VSKSLSRDTRLLCEQRKFSFVVPLLVVIQEVCSAVKEVLSRALDVVDHRLCGCFAKQILFAVVEAPGTKPKRGQRGDLEFWGHPGGDLVKRISFANDAAEIILTHHERCDGSGYPQGLKGEEIPFGHGYSLSRTQWMP